MHDRPAGSGPAQGKPAWRSTSSAASAGTSSGASTTSSAGGGQRRFLNYPRRGKGPVLRWLPGWRFILASFLSVISLGVAVVVADYVFTDIPEPEEFAMAEGSTVYFDD